MYSIVVYYFVWNEKLRDVVPMEEAVFTAKSYHMNEGRFVLLTDKNIWVYLPQNRYTQVIPIEEDK